MDENNSKEISLVDMVKTLLRRKWLIICITVVALLAGAALGVWKAPAPSYGTQVQFSITAITLDENALYQFRSEAFIEQLLLDENGLPAPADPKNPGEAYLAAAAARDAYMVKLTRRNELEKDLVNVSHRLSDAQISFDDASVDYTHSSNIYTSYLGMQVPTANYEDKLNELAADVQAKEEIYKEARQSYYAIKQESNELNAEKNLLNQQIRELQKVKNETADVLLSEWRQDETVQKEIAELKNSITFQYPSQTTKDYTNVLVFVNVTSGDVDLANRVVERLIEYMPEFVGDTDGMNVGNECVLVSTFHSVEKVDTTSWLSSGIKYAVVAAVAAFVVICLAVVFVDYFRTLLSSDAKKAENEAEEAPETADSTPDQ